LIKNINTPPVKQLVVIVVGTDIEVSRLKKISAAIEEIKKSVCCHFMCDVTKIDLPSIVNGSQSLTVKQIQGALNFEDVDMLNCANYRYNQGPLEKDEDIEMNSLKNLFTMLKRNEEHFHKTQTKRENFYDVAILVGSLTFVVMVIAVWIIVERRM
jgi:hypothetical protein